MDFLIENGFSNYFVNEIDNNLSDETKYLISYNKDSVMDNIKYFRSIGITDKSIEEVFYINEELLIKDLDDVKKIFERYDIPKLVTILNNDISYIDNIF